MRPAPCRWRTSRLRWTWTSESRSRCLSPRSGVGRPMGWKGAVSSWLRHRVESAELLHARACCIGVEGGIWPCSADESKTSVGCRPRSGGTVASPSNGVQSMPCNRPGRRPNFNPVRLARFEFCHILPATRLATARCADCLRWIASRRVLGESRQWTAFSTSTASDPPKGIQQCMDWLADNTKPL